MIGALGGFGALFDPRAAGYADPILVAATDGVGTKVKVAAETGRHDTVGIDLVAMCVNDIAVQGAEPLFFLDYFATSALDPVAAEAVLHGVAAGCVQAGCALVGGETAEMPGLYASGDFDLAGFAVGAVERGQQITGARIGAGDVVLGLASSGVHANGFSLVRRIVGEAKLTWGDAAPFATGTALGEALLTPTRIYVPAMLALARAGLAHAFAHITGGGLVENIPRVLPDGLGVRLDAGLWPIPPVFGWLKRGGAIADRAMARTFNCGIGMVAIAPPDRADEAETILREHGETVFRIGAVVPAGTDRVVIVNEAAAWARATSPEIWRA